MEPVQSQGPQLLRVFAGGAWVTKARSTARVLLLASALLPSAGCGFGMGRHGDDNRGRTRKCAQTVPCTGANHWDHEQCRCVDNENPDGGMVGAADGPSFDLGSTESEENEDASQALD